MSNKKHNQTDPMQVLEAFTRMMAVPGFETFFGGISGIEREKYPYERLGDGYELRPIEILAECGQFVIENREKYSHLYHNGLKISNEVFRKGGMSSGFKDGYCSLIHYTQKEPHTEEKHGFDFGIHVIIDSLGEIKFRPNGITSYPHHIGGHLVSLDNYIYDLRNGVAIAPRSSTMITGATSIIIEHRYAWYDKEVKLPLGVYKIDFQTVEVTKIDEVK